jgi:hypothetical protein
MRLSVHKGRVRTVDVNLRVEVRVSGGNLACGWCQRGSLWVTTGRMRDKVGKEWQEGSKKS